MKHLTELPFPCPECGNSLEVLLDPSLTLESQVDSGARGTFLQLCKLCQLWPYLDEWSLMKVTHTLVTSHQNLYA